jgi:hypothetical protein
MGGLCSKIIIIINEDVQVEFGHFSGMF